MKSFVATHWALHLAAIAFALGTGLPAPAATASAEALVSNPVVVAVRRGDCVKAVALVNPAVTSNDDRTVLFLGGRMLDEGICVKKDPVAATQYFAHAANMGYPAAALDYAAKVGLGEGTAQNYEGAGNLCHTAGLDPQNQVSRYALGYACTVRGIAGKLLRETLPQGAFRPGTGEALIEFSPSTSQMRVRSTPKVGRGEMATGSNIRRPLVDAQEEIDKAWRDALAQVPKPDAAQLGSQTIEMPLDVDMTLEVGRAPAEDLTLRPLLQSGDVHRTMN